MSITSLERGVNVRRTKPNHHTVTVDGEYAGHVFGDHGIGFTAFDHKGLRLGFWPSSDPEAKETAVAVVTEIHADREAIDLMTEAFSAHIIEVTLDRPSRRAAA